MTPVVLDALYQFALVAVPAVLTFLAGHYHIVLPNPLSNPSTPKPVDPSTPAAPVIAPIGQGGLLQVLGLVFQYILAHQTATPAQKTDAISGVVTATSPLVK